MGINRKTFNPIKVLFYRDASMKTIMGISYHKIGDFFDGFDLSYRGIPVLPLYHPSYVLRSGTDVDAELKHIAKEVEKLRRGF